MVPRTAAVFLLGTVGLMAGCRPQPGVDPGASPRDTAAIVERRPPAIPMYEIAPSSDSLLLVRIPEGGPDPFARASNRRVTLTTAGADARTLIVWLAQQAELDLVLSDDVNARVSVAFNDVPAVDALRAVLREAGLSVLTGGVRAPWAPVVFYHLPVNVNAASAEVIAARFGVSLELARFIVESRPRR